MKCPCCHKNVSKILNQFGVVKTCEFCNSKFKIHYKWKEISIYVLIIGIICGVLKIFIDNDYLSVFVVVASFPMAAKFLYKTELIKKIVYSL